MTDEMINYPQSVINRFWKYLDKRNKYNCWNWTGSVCKRGGYGQLNDRGKLLKSHRLSYELHNGKIKKGSHICHTCNNPLCCNPVHLYQGDNFTNTKDRMNAGTQFSIPILKGEKSPSSKIKWEDVLFIRKSILNGVQLSKIFRISRTSISNIRRNKTWITKK